MRNFIRNIYNKLPSGAIIMIHHVCDEKPKIPSCIISTKNFQKYIDGKRIVSISSLLKKLESGTYSLTFDDALEDLYTEVYPCLRKMGIPFTAFISAELIDKPGYITNSQLRRMASDPLVTIGSHGCTHQHLNNLSDKESRREIFESKHILESITGKSVYLIAYPFGSAGKREYKYAKKAGYNYGFDVIPRRYNILSKLFNRMKLPRYNLSNDCLNPI